MLSLFRRLPCRTYQPCLSSVCRRNFALSAARRAEVGDILGPEEAFEGAHAEGLDIASSEIDDQFEGESLKMNSGEMLEVWLQKEGRNYMTPKKPNNWLGGAVPFPLNQSFKPPIPVPDVLKTKLYQEYMTDPEKNSVRALASRCHLSMKRVDSILRLKGLEEHWKKKKTLQTGFLKGMEWCLGVTDYVQQRGIAFEGTEHPRHDVMEADILMEAEGNDPARLRYQKMFWEAVPDGQDPVVPLLLEKARQDGRRHGREEEESKQGAPFLRPQDSQGTKTMTKVKMVAPPGRPMIKFVDIGGKFIDKGERHARIKNSEHKRSLAHKRQQRKRTVLEPETQVPETTSGQLTNPTKLSTAVHNLVYQ